MWIENDGKFKLILNKTVFSRYSVCSQNSFLHKNFNTPFYFITSSGTGKNIRVPFVICAILFDVNTREYVITMIIFHDYTVIIINKTNKSNAPIAQWHQHKLSIANLILITLYTCACPCCLRFNKYTSVTQLECGPRRIFTSTIYLNNILTISKHCKHVRFFTNNHSKMIKIKLLAQTHK